jgi:hypothetical protein
MLGNMSGGEILAPLKVAAERREEKRRYRPRRAMRKREAEMAASDDLTFRHQRVAMANWWARRQFGSRPSRGDGRLTT